MKSAEIAGRMPGFRYETASTLDDIGSMVDELASAPPGHERGNQLTQQIRSHLDRVKTSIDDMQPETEEAAPFVGEPARGLSIADEGANFAGPQQSGSSDVARQQDDEPRAASEGGHIGDPVEEVVDMEKEIGGETAKVTVWFSCAHYLEKDGWKLLDGPRDREDEDRPVDPEKD